MSPIIHQEWAKARGCELHSKAERERMARSAGRARGERGRHSMSARSFLPRGLMALLGARRLRPAP